MRCIMIRGPLGVGKSTVAKAVAERIGGKYVSVDEILEQRGLDKVNDGEGIPLENFLKANVFILEEVMGEEKPVVIDGNFYHKEQIEQLVNAPGNNVAVFTLKAPVETCLARDKARTKSYGEDATRVVHMLVSRFDYGMIIHTENQTIEETVQAVLDDLVK